VRNKKKVEAESEKTNTEQEEEEVRGICFGSCDICFISLRKRIWRKETAERR
jgi:hypothetical protein